MGFYQQYQTGQMVLPAFLFENIHQLFSSSEEFLIWQMVYLENSTKNASISIDVLSKRTGMELDTINRVLNSLISTGSVQYKDTSKEDGKVGFYIDASPLFQRLDMLIEDGATENKEIANQKEFQDLLQFFEENYGRMLSSIEIEDLQKMSREVPIVLIQEAVRESLLNGKTNWRYWQAIVRSWVREGVRTKEQIQRRRDEWNLKKTRQIKASDEFKNNVNLWRMDD
ncbi:MULTISPECIES: DnaD domain-containing protein [unclassified Streptococcus]|uniref:DnaD domain-containing protein n=1 Tax=unclassified Streptococcus TaxID=2608887 RepID=UPI0010723D5D|nr:MULTISPECIES: DnaD domain protein [unclassified Streptococcus]MBF0805309.1 DnaD domain protein [Streptococcus sp. 19428wA2_WM07]TFU29343.1 DnaD domain protein [Streptococcus sp. WM07]